MHCIELTPPIKQEGSEDNCTLLDICSIAILGTQPIVRRLEHRSFQYTTNPTSTDEENTIPFGVVSSMLSDMDLQELCYRECKPIYAVVEWRLAGATDTEYPTFKTPHRITNTSKPTNKLVFARNLDWARSITTHESKIVKSQQRFLQQRRTATKATNPLKTTIPEAVCQDRRASFHRRRRREQYSSAYSIYQAKQTNIKDLRHRAEQHQQKTGDMSGLVHIMQMQRSLVSEREPTPRCQHEVQHSYSRASSNSVCCERSSSVFSQFTSSVCSKSC